MKPIEVYQTYLALKNHFTKDNYDFFKYRGKSRVSKVTFNKRKDRYFFERMSRKRTDKEIRDFFLASFSQSSDPERMWIGQIIEDGEKNYNKWLVTQEARFDIFKEQSETMMDRYEFEQFFDCSTGKHPPLLKEFLSGNFSIENVIIYEKIFGFAKNFDKTLFDPMWETVYRKIRNYEPFLNINVSRYKIHLRSRVKERFQ